MKNLDVFRTRSISTYNFRIEIFSNADGSPQIFPDGDIMGWIEYENSSKICLNWDNLGWFLNLNKKKKKELKQDLLDRGIWFEGWWKELKLLIKLAREEWGI